MRRCKELLRLGVILRSKRREFWEAKNGRSSEEQRRSPATKNPRPRIRPSRLHHGSDPNTPSHASWFRRFIYPIPPSKHHPFRFWYVPSFFSFNSSSFCETPILIFLLLLSLHHSDSISHNLQPYATTTLPTPQSKQPLKTSLKETLWLFQLLKSNLNKSNYNHCHHLRHHHTLKNLNVSSP